MLDAQFLGTSRKPQMTQQVSPMVAEIGDLYEAKALKAALESSLGTAVCSLLHGL